MCDNCCVKDYYPVGANLAWGLEKTEKLTGKDKCAPRTEWVPSDYTKENGLKDSAVPGEKKYFYDSPLALEGDIFKVVDPLPDYPPKYEVRNTSEFYVGPNPGIAGPFPYEWPYDQWGGDEKYEYGTQFYATIIDSFGHNHIMTIFNKIGVRRCNPCADTSGYQDRMLNHLLNTSTQIFRRYVALIDVQGNPIQYDPTKPSGQLTGLFNQMITGEGTNNGEIAPSAIINALLSFINPAFPQDVKDLLLIEVNKLQEIFNCALRLNGAPENRISFLAWFPMMDRHQILTYELFERYRDLFKACGNKHKYEKLLEKSTKDSLHGYDMGGRMGAFFSAFYTVVSFLDIIANFVCATPPNHPIEAIPSQYRDARVTFVHKNLLRYWNEHVHMFDDYDKAAACDDEETMYKVHIHMLESCATLGIIMGDIFRGIDKLIRKRDILYIVDNGACPP